MMEIRGQGFTEGILGLAHILEVPPSSRRQTLAATHAAVD